MEALSLTTLVISVYIMFRFAKSIFRFERGLENVIKIGSKNIDFQLDNQAKNLARKYGKLEKDILKDKTKFGSRSSFKSTMKELNKASEG